ncbi:NACHT domain-containing protein [Streptomyces sp. 891-h]|uniref:NACHT domain-containing protein n=1 Tax=Streptomyces sp. 891-h TaxID=2720714 RepID=UPI001FA9DBA1|nr:NACHT domain-containing protein [Streptomyces sp. 891-h]UNZ17952.1 NACHT domain-containing protein [Streptomyces sp. 891-h]
MDAGVAGLRIASSVLAPLVKRLFVAEGAGAGLVDRPVRLSALVCFSGEKRELGRPELEKLAGELVRRAVRDLGPQEALPPEEAEQVAARLADTLHALGDIGLSDVEAVSLGHTDFARALHAQATMHDAQPGASPAEDALYHRLLETACLHILHFLTRRSTFVARTLVEQSRKLGDLVTLVDVLIERVPSQSAQDAGFEQQYARYIANKHRTLTIYGIDVQQASEWPLDTAYLSLHATSTAGHGGPHQEADWKGTGGDGTADPQPVEQALSGHRRVLLRGIAGSGKTTLVQWLAVTTARQSELTGQLAHLIGRVPFVLPLRTLTRGGAALPPPADFLAAVGCPLAGAQPGGWADRVLAAGRGVLLVDGIDEVPEEERTRVRAWLHDLTLAYPDNLLLATCRPSAVRENWLVGDDFTELSLSPMRPADVDLFIDRWHAAAEADEELADALRTAVRARPDLSLLATNPLMCGLLCALHRERHGFLPRGRKALYDAALSMLLERRDRERAVYAAHPASVELDEDSQVELLQKLAYWLIRNGRSEMAQSDAVDLVERMLPAMPYVAEQGSATEIFRFLLVRSGLLREPGHGAVDFVHRTFQDYLGAKAAVEERDFGVLVHSAHLDQWEDVVRMAVAHARPDERARLLRGLVQRGDAEPECRARLHLLAMACLEHATKLDPAVREEVEARAGALIPPRSVDEAKALVPLGGVVLDLFSGLEELDDDGAVAVAHTAAQMGTDAALVLLKRFVDHPSSAVLQQLAGHWDRFDTDAYAKEILAHLPDRRGVRVTASTAEHLAWLRRLGQRSAVRIRGAFDEREILDSQPTPTELEELAFSRNPAVERLDFVQAFPSLDELELRECTVRDLSPLGALPVTSLRLWDVRLLSDLRGSEALASLRHLALRQGTPWPGPAWLEHLSELTYLALPEYVGSITGIAALRALETLNLFHVRTRFTARDWEELSLLPRLALLTCEPAHLADLESARARFPALQELHVVMNQTGFDARLLRAAFPTLETLFLTQPPASFDLAALADLPNLRTVLIARPERPIDTTRHPSHLNVSVLSPPRRG